jgi:hypothetical protein
MAQRVTPVAPSSAPKADAPTGLQMTSRMRIIAEVLEQGFARTDRQSSLGDQSCPIPSAPAYMAGAITDPVRGAAFPYVSAVT